MKKYLSIAVDDHIFLVQPEMTMSEQLFQTIQANLSYLKTYLSFIHEDMSLDEEKDYLKMMIEQQAQGTGRLFVIYYEDELIGTIDLHHIDKEHAYAEVGYWIAAEYSGKQIITKCLETVKMFAFSTLRLNKLIIYADIENLASGRVALKAGFKHVGELKQHILVHGMYRSLNIFECLNMSDSE
ncbi:GNAT family N-acetyltransferase [Staphylococcus sp. SQ8-PEA]|uniref:GNAT family N-acetyltransferase n=1 Tax=Staphylococcus marylandisciuri TaxID=2981529 RepID=A0ABT2QN07_9STAP|nr:GNAT family protein [Staphylococcus marylandisciuri]MCU5745358.1 GNAT family N-acetyltransferase [Staphylococcus marylandisciuri]